MLACGLLSWALGTLWFSPGPEQVSEHGKGLQLWLGDSVAAWISLLVTLTGGLVVNYPQWLITCGVNNMSLL